jgi:hypothetical protein
MDAADDDEDFDDEEDDEFGEDLDDEDGEFDEGDDEDEYYDEDEDDMTDRTDSVARLVEAWQIAKAIAPEMPFDPNIQDSRAVKLEAIARIDSDIADELKDESEDYIDGYLISQFGDDEEKDDEYEDEDDGEFDYTPEEIYQRDSLLDSVTEARRTTSASRNVIADRAAEIGEAWQQPLSMSKSR